MPTTIETKRLILRTWCDDDLEPMFRINKDPKVMEYLLPRDSKQETKDFIGLLHRKKVPFNDSNPST
ncbi:MAG: GNAT family N-acetyltransferase [Legionellaceae bacterium]|nr:GNAT family N-acetyltransferase [Legionellaceae bacterium]